jgi:uncharacterized protein (TIRG00374 family)
MSQSENLSGKNADLPADLPAKKSNSLIKQLVGILLALGFLWLAFRGVDPQRLWFYVSRMQPLYLIPLAISGLLSHFVRAYRWQVLLLPVAGRKVSLFNSFCAVILGYAVNVVLPRGGEVARLVSIVRSEKLAWAGVLSTMFIDRLLDIALLVFLLAITLISFPKSMFGNLDWLMPAGFTLAAMVIVGLVLLPFVADIINWLLTRQFVQKRVPEKFVQMLSGLAREFGMGCQCLKDWRSYPIIAISSLGIWFFYWLNLYLMLYAFGLNQTVSAVQSLIIFTIGSVGVLIPTPGSVGSYHFLISQALVLIAHIDKEQALAFASVLHAFSFVLITTIPAAICVFIQSTQKKNAAAAQAGS